MTKTILCILFYAVSAATALAQGDFKWYKSCTDNNGRNAKCLNAGTTIELPGVNADQMTDRILAYVKQQIESSSTSECTFTDENLDEEQYPMCWTQSDWERKKTKEHDILFSARRMNPDPAFEDYEFEVHLVCKEGKLYANFYYNNQFNNVKFIKDRDGENDPGNRKLYKRFTVQYHRVMDGLLEAAKAPAAPTEQAKPGESQSAPAKKRL